MPRGLKPTGRVAADRRSIERLLTMLVPAKQAAYKRIDSGDKAFKAAYVAADKSLPICEECGRNCRPILADRDFQAEYWSHCCYAPIEQDAGSEP